MDETTSLRNRTYGFSDGGREVYSNIPLSELERKLGTLEKLNQGTLLKPDKNLVIVDLNRNHLGHVLSELFPDVVSPDKKEIVPTEEYTHHTQNYFVDVYRTPPGNLIDLVYGRTKGRDSVIEKLTRKFSENGTMGYSDSKEYSFHIDVLDIYAFTLVASDEKACYRLEEQLCQNPLLGFINKDDYLAEGIKDHSIHFFFTWQGEDMPKNTIIEIHLETRDDFYGNRNIDYSIGGGKNKPSKSTKRNRLVYDLGKLEKPHNQGENQIILLEKNGILHGELNPLRFENEKLGSEFTVIKY